MIAALGDEAPNNLGSPENAELQFGVIVKKVAPGGGAKKEEFDRGRRVFTVDPSDSRASLVGP
jgi:hypothetical protein